MTRLSYVLRKHPAARALTLFLVVVLGVAFLSFLTRTVLHKPEILEINPAVGTPGDVLLIKGNFFGKTRDSSYVELCGNRLTESSYLSWSDTQIKVIIPGNTEDGLVYVVNRSGKSNPDFFANELAIPVYMPANPMMDIPVISEISVAEISPGQVLVLTGKNFGGNREGSQVYFTSHRENSTEEKIPDLSATEIQGGKEGQEFPGFITPSEADYDYEYWSESEIRVRVPDGAETGSVFVATTKGRSTLQPLSVKSRIGTKDYHNRHTYVVQVGADLYNIRGKRDAAVTIHLPHPVRFSLQPQIAMTETVPEPSLMDYRNTSIFQITPADGTSAENTSTAHQNFAVTCSSLETQINKDAVRAFSEKNRMLFRAYTRADDIVPADHPDLVKLLPDIVFSVKNPYRRAELIFDYMTANYKILDRVRKNDSDPMDLVKRKRGDAYDFAVIYTALLRTAGIPSRVISGVLVNADKQTQNHWWSEFYLEGFGWVPVDAALGAGLPFKAFQSEQNSGKYYFGNIDAQHIAFSLYYNVIKQSLLNNKIVSMPRSFALQSIWEESSGDVESYSSYWHTPAVLGIY